MAAEADALASVQRPGMIRLPGGEFTMGADRFYPEERPARRVSVSPFWMDETPVTNRQFKKFVRATGYRTFAEIAPDPRDYPGMPADMAKAGSLVFTPPRQPTAPDDHRKWWSFSFGACWEKPLGPGSSLKGIEDHPVVHVVLSDVEAYAGWAGKSLPTEAEWEFAARGGLDDADYAWGAELAPGGAMMANYWQGQFPWQNLKLDGWVRTSPVRAFAANGFGLHDMIGNVWEWTSDWWQVRSATPAKACCVPANPRGGMLETSYDPATPAMRIGRKVIKGGSHLCAENYCQRYRPAARHPQAIDSSTSHVGFRLVVREAI